MPNSHVAPTGSGHPFFNLYGGGDVLSLMGVWRRVRGEHERVWDVDRHCLISACRAWREMTDEELEAAEESWERSWLDDLEPVQFFEGDKLEPRDLRWDRGVIAFWDCQSKGTRQCIEEAEARDLDVYELRPPRQ